MNVFSIIKYLLWFIIINLVKMAIWVGSWFDPALYVLRISHHPGEWVWLNGNLCFVDVPLIKHVKRLNSAGYETTNCCQGSDFVIGASRHFITPYIAAKELPRSFIEDCLVEGFRVESCIDTKSVAVYALYDNRHEDTKPGASQKNFDVLCRLLDKWHQDKLSVQE